MTAVAVNCLVDEARRKLVCALILLRVRRSVTPYPRRKAMRPSRITSTAAPGPFSDFRLAKIAATSSAEGSEAAAMVAINVRINPKTNRNQRIMRPPTQKSVGILQPENRSMGVRSLARTPPLIPVLTLLPPESRSREKILRPYSHHTHHPAGSSLLSAVGEQP